MQTFEECYFCHGCNYYYRYKIVQVVSAKRKCELPAAKVGESSSQTKSDDTATDADINTELQSLCNLYDLVIGEDDEPPTKINKAVKDLKQIGAITCNGIPLVKVPTSEKVESIGESSSSGTKKNAYVFDIYIAKDPSIGDVIHNQFVSVQRLEEELVFEESDEEFAVEDEEDSNDEGNWRNDYPDSDYDKNDDNFYFGEAASEDEDISSRFSKFGITQDLSSDDDEERHPIYTMEDDGADGGQGGFLGKYAAYKARIQKQLELADEVVSSESDSD